MQKEEFSSPATFRKQLQAASEERLVLRKDVYQDCLVLYPESVWFATQKPTSLPAE